jgi:phage shock protein A
MWSKLKQQISNIFGKNQNDNLQNQTPTPEQADQMIQKTLQALQEAKMQASTLYTQTQNDEQRLQKNINQLQEEIQNYIQKAQKALAQKNETEAKTILQQKQIAQDAQLRYRQMHHEVAQRMLQLQQQIQAITLKHEELLLKKNTLFDTLKNAESQKNLGEYMKNLQGVTGLEGFEQEVEKIKIETQLQYDFQQSIQGFEIENTEFSAITQNNAIQNFKNEQTAQQKQQNEKIINKQVNRHHDFFEQKKSNEKQDKNQDRDQKIDNFFDQKEEKKEPQKTNQDVNTPQIDKQKKIDDFFN